MCKDKTEEAQDTGKQQAEPETSRPPLHTEFSSLNDD